MKPEEKEIHARQFPVHVGVDTGKRFHVLVARGPDWKRLRPKRVEVTREGSREPVEVLRRPTTDLIVSDPLSECWADTAGPWYSGEVRLALDDWIRTRASDRILREFL